MAAFAFRREELSLRFGDTDTPAPEGGVPPDVAPRVIVAVEPPDPRVRVQLRLRVNGGREVGVALRPERRTGTEQFFEGSFPNVRISDHVEYSIRVELERKGRTVRLDSSEAPGGLRQFQIIGSGARPTEIEPRVRTTGPDNSSARSAELAEKVAARPAVGGSFLGVGEAGPTGPMDAGAYTVAGTVASPDRAGVGGLRIQVVDRNVGSDVQLAEGVTDEDGRFSTRFALSPQRAPHKAKPDLQARAYSAQTFLAASDVRYNADNQETLNILLPPNCDALPSEHETLTRVLLQKYGGRLGDLKESDDRQDITYLANKTGWDARAVALAALADQFSERAAQADVPASFFYALFRAGLPANEDTLYHTEAKTLEGVWRQAAAQGVIPKASSDQIPNLIARFRTISAQKLLTAPALVGASPLKEMLTISRLNEAQQAKFAQLYAANRGDMPSFWKAVNDAFGKDVASRLQVDGKLGFLTINNARLMQKVHAAAGANGLSDPLQLAQLGYHRAEPWSRLLTTDVPIPKEIPGAAAESKRANYAAYLAAQVRLSYPTAAVAQMVKSRELPLKGAPQGVPDRVHAFLTEHQGSFEIGVQPVEQFITQNKLSVAKDVVAQVSRLQRVYQITPSDQALTGLLKRGIDSAYQVVRYDKETFVQSFAADLEGADSAALTFDKSVQVHNVVLNVALNYLTARTAPAIGVHSPPSVLDPAPANAGDVIAYATLESLFGSMDFCACAHCRSILSPAAYLVDLLLFLHADEQEWKDYCGNWSSEHGAPYPFPNKAVWDAANNPQNTEISPLDVLLSRRPDIEYLPLTCENTNTPLPYIDVVNETLEHFTANESQKLSLKDYAGHDTNETVSEDLLATPQFVMDAAYTTLRGERFPDPLPFHQPLENLRRYFNKFEVPLQLAMERLCKSSDLERGANPYGWRDILMEEIGLSRAEHEVLTDSTDVPLWSMYGFPNGTADADVLAGLSNAKQFTRRVGITYEDLICILKTRFMNPNSDLISKVERLGVNFAMLTELKTKNDPPTDAKFDALLAALAAPPDRAEYGGDIKAWVKDDENYARIMGLITLAIPAGTWAPSKAYAIGDCARPIAGESERTLYYECTTSGTSAAAEPTWPTTPGNTYRDATVVWTTRDASSCLSFDNFAFRYADPAKIMQDIGAAEFVRLMRFIRLWRKLGWSIAQTDDAICALYRSDLVSVDASDMDTVAKVDAGFLTLLPRLGVVKRLMRALSLASKRDLSQLLTCFAPISTHDGAEWFIDDDVGDRFRTVPSLYRQLFLNSAMLGRDEVFADNGYGEFLQRADISYTHPQPALEQAIVDAAQGKISYNASTERLFYTGVLDAATRNALLSLPGVSPDFQQAVGGLYRVQRLATHAGALRSAFNLTGDEYERIVASLGYDADTLLTIPNITAIFRRGYLARKLKISVRELLLLIQLTGLDPFAAPNATSPAILRLIELVQSMRDRSFKSAAALYLIWNQDLSGKSMPEVAQVTAFARTLRLGFATVEADFAVADDPDGAIAQTRMAMVYGSDAATFFFGLLNDMLTVEVEFSDPEGTLAPIAVRQAIESAAGTTDASVPRIVYDDFRKRLSYSGVLTTAARDAIKMASGAGAAAFKSAVDTLYDKNQGVISPFFARYAELQLPYNAYIADTTHSITEKRSNLLKAILPELVQRLKRQQALQSVSAVANSDLSFVQTFLDPPSAPFPLHAVGQPDQPGLNDLLAAERPGLSVQFFANDTAIGPTIAFPDIASNLDYGPTVGVGNPLAANPTAGAAISGVWRGYLEAPESGVFNLRVEADASATVTLILDDRPITLTQNATFWLNADPIELRAGTLYRIGLTVEKVRDVVRIEWDWDPKGQGHSAIPARYLYPVALFERFQQTYVRFLKAASLATGLGLTANELKYFATQPDYQINAQGQIDSNGQGWLNAVPSADNLQLTDPADAAVAKNLNAALLAPLGALLDFARIKAEISPSDESLLTVLEDSTTATQNTDSLLFTITRWNQTSLNDVLGQFGGNVAGLRHFDLFRRIYDVFALVQKMGIAAKGLINATTNEPTADTVHALQAALRARYAAADWRDVVRPINDEMRGLQRDALVAYILHQMRSHVESAHVDTADKLFEYFLMDVQMDSCMQTSRIRHALSSVQLFIERCLMNLEPRVSSAAINAKQWQWMKRYRVWEANRKVYLFPENWLEPELRDDKSPFFKEIESELLQSDITEDLATTALLNYLSKLEEVAKLEPCGIYHIPADPGNRTGEINHVVARTAGAHRKYYYRRYEFGYWTPWEQIKLDIEDNPVIPVVWKDRLLLFWLRIFKQSSLGPDSLAASPGPSDGKSLANVSLSEMKTSAKQDAKTNTMLTVQAVLCWSEYYNGKWQPTKTSDVNRPTDLGTYDAPNGFDRSAIWLSTVEEGDGHYLRISIEGDAYSTFLLYNTHSLPVREEDAPHDVGSMFFGPRTLASYGDSFSIYYYSSPDNLQPGFGGKTLTPHLLSNQIPDRTVETTHPLQNIWLAPFFYEDSRHAFYVTTTEQQLWVSDYEKYGVLADLGIRRLATIPPLVFQVDPRGLVKPKPWGDGEPIRTNPGVIDPAPMKRLVTEDAYIRQGIAAASVVMYGDRQIGPSGAISNVRAGR
jgi:hypothetical protein